MPVPYTFASATSAIPLSNLDSNFATAITLGNVAVQLGNTVTTIGNVTLANPTVSTNLNFSSGTNGIVFNNSGATTNSTLNDYETGTFTPSLNFSGGTTGITYANAFGKYTKIGNIVYVQIGINLSSKGSSIGNAGITGLPFSSTNPGAYGDGSLAISFGASMTASTPFTAIVNRGASTASFNFFTTSGSAPLLNSDFTNASSIVFGGTYQATF